MKYVELELGRTRMHELQSYKGELQRKDTGIKFEEKKEIFKVNKVLLEKVFQQHTPKLLFNLCPNIHKIRGFSSLERILLETKFAAF